jgi:hypothetical protein
MKPQATRYAGASRRMSATLLGMAVSVSLLTAGCTSASSSGAGSGGRGADTSPQAAATIMQRDVGNFRVAPEGERVDLVMPTFSDPTKITNPLFPVSRQESVLLLGRVEGKAFRTEVSLLPDTRIIEWRGQQVEVLVSQYVAFLDGRIHEVAYDFYAQDDDGSVWYFGEDVFNFSDGAIADTHGTWIAGKDGPAAMIMPADPAVGDTWRTENIPGIAFEEVSVKTVNKTLNGPLGPVEGGLIAGELHMDATSENKTFAPDYGEFLTSGAGDVEALALAVPTNALAEAEPDELSVLLNGASAVLNAVENGNWKAASASVGEMSNAWQRYPSGATPTRIAPRMTAALKELGRVVRDRNSAAARQAAIEATQWALDLELLYRPVQEVDLGRLALWTTQLQLDADRGNAGAMSADFFTIDLIRDRVLGVLDGAETNSINLGLQELEGALLDEDYSAARKAAGKLRTTLSGIDITT